VYTGRRPSVNIVRLAMGHEQTSTTLDIYTHAPDDYERRVTDAFNSSVACLLPLVEDHDTGGVEEADDDAL
jgi:hypothetical protein